MNFRSASVSLLIILIFTLPLLAQYDYADPLRLDITPYVWMASLNGEVSINGQSRDVNFTFSDFFKFSSLGLNGSVELKKKNWAVFLDYNYVDLLKENTYTELVLTDLVAAIRVYNIIQVLAGGRYYKAIIEYRDDPQNFERGKNEWIDPLIGARANWDISRDFVLMARTDLGGFGVGSDLQWNLMGSVGYNLANITFTAFYRICYADYQEGSTDERFTYDILSSGPGLAMVIHF